MNEMSPTPPGAEAPVSKPHIIYYPELIQGHEPLAIDRGHLMSRLSYDPDTGAFTWVVPPHNHPRLKGKNAGGNGTGYTMIKIDGQKYKAHRLAWLYVYGETPRSVIDHKDGNPFNNAIGNLRLASQAQNCANAKLMSGKDLPKGVRKNRNGYTARIGFKNKLITIGTFPNPDEAAAAYLQEARRLYGDFARAE